MHQDNFYLLAAPATCIAAWTAIDAAKVENGCLYERASIKNMAYPIACYPYIRESQGTHDNSVMTSIGPFMTGRPTK